MRVLQRCAVVLLSLCLAGCYYYPPPGYPYSYGGYPYGGYYSAAPYGYANGQQPSVAKPNYPPPAQQECRQYSEPAIIEGRSQTLTGTACHQPDNSWRDATTGAIVNMTPAPSPHAAELEPTETQSHEESAPTAPVTESTAPNLSVTKPPAASTAEDMDPDSDMGTDRPVLGL